MQTNPVIEVDLVYFPEIKPHVEITIKERDPGSGLHRELRVKATGERRLLMKLREWSGHRAELDVDLANATARLRGPASSLPAVDALTWAVYDQCVELLCAA